MFPKDPDKIPERYRNADRNYVVSLAKDIGLKKPNFSFGFTNRFDGCRYRWDKPKFTIEIDKSRKRNVFMVYVYPYGVMGINPEIKINLLHCRLSRETIARKLRELLYGVEAMGYKPLEL